MWSTLAKLNWLTSLPEVTHILPLVTLTPSTWPHTKRCMDATTPSSIPIRYTLPLSLPLTTTTIGIKRLETLAYQALKLARARSARIARKRRNEFKPVEIGGW